MENNIDILDIFKRNRIPDGAEFYSPICGTMTFKEIKGEYLVFECTDKNGEQSELTFDRSGRIDELFTNGECMIYPSSTNMKWLEFKYDVPCIDKNLDEIVASYVYDKLHLTMAYFNDMTAKVKALVKMIAVADYLNDGWDPAVNFEDQKYCIYICDYDNGVYEINIDTTLQLSLAPCHFKSIKVAEKAIKILGKETIKTALS